jgi:hypothetical protein
MNKRTYPFNIEVIIYRRPHLRDDALNFEAYMGYGVLESLFDKMETIFVKDIFLSYPERWLNIIEQRQLFNRLRRYCPMLESVKIKTHSVYIVQCTSNECAKLVKDSSLDIDQMNESIKQYCKNEGNLFDLTGLNVMTAEGVLNISTKTGE